MNFLDLCKQSVLNRNDIEHLIDLWIFNEIYRKMLKRRLLDGITYEKLAEEFDISVIATKNIIYKTEKKLFPIIEKQMKEILK